ncbi:MAG: hybrid sensor histidine kinase/response regulator [Chloroflexi bacterium]|nr:hybrid sensor histidine kinase/response regulator [Chloroflexota bacterium]
MSEQTILIVEDHGPLLSAVRAALESENYTVLTATDGVEALEAMEGTRPDLIVADIMMPRMDGEALYANVRARPEWVPIPFIFLTAKASKEDIMRGKALGAEDYITKPFDLQELLVAIRARLGRAQAIRKATTVEFDELKQQIVTILSHELRTPLTYIQGYTSLALDDVPTLPPDALQEFLEAIKRGADRLTRLVEDLLLLVRLDTGRAMEEFKLLVHTHHDLDAILERTVHQYEEQAAAHGVTLEIGTVPDLPPVRLCEPLFVDALGRLVDNGIKFSRGKGKLVTVSGRVTDGWIEVLVQDEGVGIAAEEIPHLFERFRQINREQMEQQGVGLGLAITKELIRLHGGEVTVESEPDVGSTFAIRLPIAEV